MHCPMLIIQVISTGALKRQILNLNLQQQQHTSIGGSPSSYYSPSVSATTTTPPNDALVVAAWGACLIKAMAEGLVFILIQSTTCLNNVCRDFCF